jgi:hypothetical protein
VGAGAAADDCEDGTGGEEATGEEATGDGSAAGTDGGTFGCDGVAAGAG